MASTKQSRKERFENKAAEPALPVNPRMMGKELRPDPRFDSLMLGKFINTLMLSGKKSTAQRIIYDCFDIINKRTGQDPLETFNQAIEAIKPEVELKSKRVGGTTYQVPMRVTKRRQLALAFRWLIGAARGRKGRPMAVRLADELLDAVKKDGAAYKKREDTHRMAEANKAFSHFAF